MRIVLLNLIGQKPNPVYEILESELRKRGHEVIVAEMNEKSEFNWRKNGRVFATQDMSLAISPRARGIPVVSTLSLQAKKLQSIRQVRAMLRELQPDIVQINTMKYPELIPLLMPRGIHFAYDIRQINVKMTDKFVGQLKEKLAIFRMFLCGRFFYDYTFFCHRGAAERVLGEEWPRRSEVIPVAVDDYFLQSGEFIQAPRDDEPVIFAYVGSLGLIRNLDQLFAAAKILKAEGLNFQMTFTGPDLSNGHYQKTIDEMGVGSIVKMEGPVPYEAIPEVLSRAHVGLAYVPDRPTWHYQPTIKVKEYRALGLPILSTDVASHHEFVEDGVNGVMVADSPQGIADGMRRFIIDRDFLRRSVANAQSMRAGITWAEVAEMYEDAYVRLMGQNEGMMLMHDVAELK